MEKYVREIRSMFLLILNYVHKYSNLMDHLIRIEGNMDEDPNDFKYTRINKFVFDIHYP